MCDFCCYCYVVLFCFVLLLLLLFVVFMKQTRFKKYAIYNIQIFYKVSFSCKGQNKSKLHLAPI